MKLFNGSRCYNGGQRHCFEARFNEVPNNVKIGWLLEPQNIRRLLYYEVYVKDVCIWCGKEIKK